MSSEVIGKAPSTDITALDSIGLGVRPLTLLASKREYRTKCELFPTLGILKKDIN